MSSATVTDREFTIRARSQREQIVRRFLHNRPATLGLVVLGVLLLMAFIAPMFYPYSYGDLDGQARSVGPSGEHPLGTETLGRDLLAMMMRGVQRSALICSIVVCVAGVIGLLVGSAAGYYGGRVDNLLMRVVDLVLTMPIFVVILVVAAAYPAARSAVGIGVIIGCFTWTALARIVRAQFLSLREREFVEAAHALGARDSRIIVKHLLPNALGAIIVWATLEAAAAVLVEAALSFLGYGVSGSETSLGRLVADGVSAADSRPWLFYFPGLILMILLMCVSLVGDGIRDAFDNHQRVRA